MHGEAEQISERKLLAWNQWNVCLLIRDVPLIDLRKGANWREE
jgi:hypothetical protein